MQSSDRDLALRLAIGVIAAVGIVAVVWLMGYLGFRLGFAPLIDVPQLQAELGTGLLTGTIMLISVPKMIVLAGEVRPGMLMLAFVLIAIPAAGLSAARPRPRSTESASSAAVTFSYAGAIGAGVNALMIIWWTASTLRNGRIADVDEEPVSRWVLPIRPADAGAWLEGLHSIAGLDVLAVVIAALWVVLVMRLAIPLWLRALASTASMFTLVVVTVAMSMSNAAVAQIEKDRSEVFLDDGSLDTRLLLGFTPGHAATLRAEGGVAVVVLHDRSDMMTVVRRQSIIGMLMEAERRSQKIGTSTYFGPKAAQNTGNQTPK